MNHSADLTIRQFERSEVVLDGEFEVAPCHADQVAFSAAAGAASGSRVLRITVSDIGAGGIGFHAPLSLPRMLCGEVRIFEPDPHAQQGGGRSTRCIAFQHAVRIRRCELTSRVPSFFIGSSFENGGDQLDTALKAMLEKIAVSMRRQMTLLDPGAGVEAGRA